VADEARRDPDGRRLILEVLVAFFPLREESFGIEERPFDAKGPAITVPGRSSTATNRVADK